VLSIVLWPSNVAKESAAAVGGEIRRRSDAARSDLTRGVMRQCPGAGNMGKELLLGGRPWLLATVFPYSRPPIGGKGAKMMSNDVSQGGIQINRSLLVGGGVLVGIGGLLGFTGMMLVGSALLSATRQWVNQLERPPSELARRKWQQARAAAAAGAGAWRNGPQTPSSPS
jgi:hypothetical protein